MAAIQSPKLSGLYVQTHTAHSAFLGPFANLSVRLGRGRFEAERGSRRGEASTTPHFRSTTHQSTPQPPSKIEAEDEREVLRGQRKPSEDTVGRRSGLNRNRGTSSNVLPSVISHAPPPSTPSAADSAAPASVGTSTTKKQKLRKLGGTSSRTAPATTPLKEHHSHHGTGNGVSASPSADSGIVQKMSKKMTGILPAPRRRRDGAAAPKPH
jgi:hypothetical protein